MQSSRGRTEGVETPALPLSARPREAAPASRFLTAGDGVRLHFLHWPAGDGPVRGSVVLLHGIAGHAAWFAGVSEHLAAAGLPVYALDRRGSGRSEGGRGHLDRFEDALTDLQSALDRAAAEQPGLPRFLIASSWAAKLAVIHAAHSATCLTGLVLLEPVFVTRANLSLLRRLAVAAGHLVAPRWRLPLPVSPEMATPNREHVSRLRDDPLRLRSATARFYWETGRMDRLRTRLAPALRLPLLVLQGDADPIADLSATHRWLARVTSPDKTVILYSGAGHALDFEPDPRQFRADLLQWLLARSATPAPS